MAHCRQHSYTPVHMAIILNKIMYALPVYFGYLTDRQKHQLQQKCDRAKCSSFSSHDYNIEIPAEEAEYNLFHNSCSENHGLRHGYTPFTRASSSS